MNSLTRVDGGMSLWSAAACCRLVRRSLLRRVVESSCWGWCAAASCRAEGASELAHSKCQLYFGDETLTR